MGWHGMSLGYASRCTFDPEDSPAIQVDTIALLGDRVEHLWQAEERVRGCDRGEPSSVSFIH